MIADPVAVVDRLLGYADQFVEDWLQDGRQDSTEAYREAEAHAKDWAEARAIILDSIRLAAAINEADEGADQGVRGAATLIIERLEALGVEP